MTLFLKKQQPEENWFKTFFPQKSTFKNWGGKMHRTDWCSAEAKAEKAEAEWFAKRDGLSSISVYVH